MYDACPDPRSSMDTSSLKFLVFFCSQPVAMGCLDEGTFNV